MPIGRRFSPYAALLAAACPWGVTAGLPPVPVPVENPITEPKRVLGKILFWDEQLSSDNSVACGTCHRASSGGADPRSAVHPGVDKGTIDDVHGSPGIARLDRNGRLAAHPVFAHEPQVTARSTPSNFGALWAAEIFWDGRAGPEFRDPLSGDTVIASGGALENQVVMALSNDVEMTKQARTWSELADKLARVEPLALASAWPADLAAAIAANPDYPALFATAFGDTAITPVRIAFAIASYQRTLIADQTAWDRYRAGDETAMSQSQIYGWRAFQSFHCASCHTPPLFTNNGFFNIAVRRAEYDRGRQAVTGDPEDAGEMKVPSLRDVGLRPRYMHTGEFTNLGAAISFYVTASALPDRDEIPGAGIYTFNISSLTVADIRDFLAKALTDPRVRDEIFPFDRPVLRSETHRGDSRPPAAPTQFAAEQMPDGVRLSWNAAQDDTGVADYVLRRGERVIAYSTATRYEDRSIPAASTATYSLIARDAAANSSPRVTLTVALQ